MTALEFRATADDGRATPAVVGCEVATALAGDADATALAGAAGARAAAVATALVAYDVDMCCATGASTPRQASTIGLLAEKWDLAPSFACNRYSEYSKPKQVQHVLCLHAHTKLQIMQNM